MTYESKYCDGNSHETDCSCCYGESRNRRRASLPITNTHCHPFKPARPSIVLCIAVIMRPANMLPTWPIAVKIAVLVAISEGLLQFRLESCLKQPQWASPSPGVNLLPRAEHINGSTIDRPFHHTLEETHDAELLVVLACGRAHGQAGPDDEGQWEPYSGSDLLDDYGMRYLADYTPTWRSAKGTHRRSRNTCPVTNIDKSTLNSLPWRFRSSFNPATW